MPQAKLEYEVKGLVTAPGQLARTPGSLTVATNVNIPAPGLIAKRTGIYKAAFGFGGSAWKIVSTKQLGNNLLCNTGNGTSALNLVLTDGTTVPTTLSPPDGSSITNTPAKRMRAAVSLATHFLTSSRAPLRYDTGGSLEYAGMPRSPGCILEPIVNASSNWLAAGWAVAYRIVWGIVDANGATRLSAPSGRYVVANIATTTGYTGAALSPRIFVQVPVRTDTGATAVTTSWFFQIYRSFSVNTATGQPGDEMQLCFQRNVTAPEIAAGSITIDDTCPEATLGAYLYTNSVSGGDVGTAAIVAGSAPLGLAASNDRPPLATEVVSFANCLWWANFTTLYRIQVSILAVGAAGNVLKAGDILTIAGTTYTAVAGAPAGPNQFRVQTGLGTVSENIRATAISLVQAINSNTFNTTVTAAYIGSDASPGTIGQILIEARRSDASSFTMSTSGSAVPFLPQLTLTSTRDNWTNGLAISKPFQGDSVPPANYIRVGRTDTEILALVPLRDALFIFTDDGVWWARGTSPSDFVVEQFDATFRLLARESAVALEDAVYAWGSEGIARITLGGVEYIDLPIRPTIQAAVSTPGISVFASYAFAVAYRTARRVLFFAPSTSLDTACMTAFVFNSSMNAWTTYDLSTTGAKSTGAVRYVDELLCCGAWSSGADTAFFSDATSKYDDQDGAGTITAITSNIEWSAQPPNPSVVCHWSELQMYWDNATAIVDPTQAGTITCNQDSGAFAQWAYSRSEIRLVSRYPMTPAVGFSTRQRISLTHNSATYFGLNGMALLYTPVSNFSVR